MSWTTSSAGELSVESVNAARWPSAQSVRRRARRGLRPVEAALSRRYRLELSGNVLEIGSRGDGLTGMLAHHAAQFTGIGFSTPEVEHCRGKHADAEFLERNLVDLDEFSDEQFDAVVVGRCALDRLGDEQRRQLLERLARIVTEDGVIIFSSHNLACESLVRPPVPQACTRPWTLWKLPRALKNRALLARLQQRSYGFAILNDAADDYSRLTYYISRDAQAQQLRELDYTLVECVDRDDEPVLAGADAYRRRELYFVARRGAVTPTDSPSVSGEIV